MAESPSKWVENTFGKGEIARYKQFLLFPQCFQKTCTADTQKPGLFWERFKSLHMDYVYTRSLKSSQSIEKNIVH